MQEFIEPVRTDTEAGDDLAGMQSLMAPGDHTFFDEILDWVGDDVRVNAKVSAVMQVLQSLIGNTPEIDVQRRAILNNLCDITGDALGNRIGRLMQIFDKPPFDADKAIDPINVKESIA